jgi:hypothetical protein
MRILLTKYSPQSEPKLVIAFTSSPLQLSDLTSVSIIKVISSICSSKKMKPITHLFTAPANAMGSLSGLLSTQSALKLGAWVLTALALIGTARSEIFISNISEGSGRIASYSTSGALINASVVSGFSNSDIPFVLSGTSLFVSDYPQNAIRKYTTSGTLVDANFISGLPDHPGNLAVAGSDLFVTHINGPFSQVGSYTTSGATTNAALISAGLFNPFGIAVSGPNLYIANYGGSNTIGKYDSATGNLIETMSISGLTSMTSIAISGSNLYVLDIASSTIGAYDITTGVAVNANLISGLISPMGMAISGSSLYVTSYNGDGSNGIVGEYTLAGDTINATLISGLNSPYYIAIGAIPEPSTSAALAGAAMLGLAMRRRRA